MKKLNLFLTLVGFLLLLFGAVGSSHAAECGIYAQYMGLCSSPVDIIQTLAEVMKSSPFTRPA